MNVQEPATERLAICYTCGRWFYTRPDEREDELQVDYCNYCFIREDES